MDFENFKKLVDKVKKNHPVWFDMEPDDAPSNFVVSDAEEKLGVKLPVDYKDFVCEYGGGYFAFSSVYSLEVGSDWNLVDMNCKYKKLRGDYVLVSENGVGDFYGYKVVNGVCDSEIYFYDHDVGVWQGAKYRDLFEYLEKVALSN
ncbi:SMI1/KNR4 family protein [Pseudomonas sp. NCHU5208]|uniref:SMI1/KNR4 family protein n=1 Tax=unclassified Pseudomonas TaxID=196821 RepID=UPI003F987B9E